MGGQQQWIGDWMACMADAAVESAQVLDEHNRQAQGQFMRLAKAAGVDEMPDLLKQLAPPTLRFQRHQFDASMKLSVRHERPLGVNVQIFGRTITSLYHARFGDESTTYDQLTVHVVAVPCNPEPEKH